MSDATIANWLQRIAIFRQYAPNTLLSASGGFWTLDYGSTIPYSKFKPVDAKLDLRATLLSSVSEVSSCCWRQLGGIYGPTTNFDDGSTLTEAKQAAAIINRRGGYMKSLWGTTTRKWFAADVAVTDCGWGVSGQAAIIQNIIDNMPTMFSNGFRGMVLRNLSPPNEFRFMGQNNEAGFTWYPPSSGNYITSTTIAKGLTQAVNLMKGLSYSSTTIAVAAVASKWTSSFIQVSATPNTNVASLSYSFTDLSKVVRTGSLPLISGTTNNYGAKPAVTMPAGAAVTITVTLKSGVQQKTTLTNGQSRSVTKKLPGFNAYWIQVVVSPSTGVTAVSGSYVDAAKITRTVTLTKNSADGSYMGGPPNQIPYGGQVTITVTSSGGQQKAYLTSGTSLTVASVAGWNSWWIQLSVSPNTLVSKVTASFTDASKVKRTVTLSKISGTTQYSGSPGAQIPTGGQVAVATTLTDGTVQTYYITNKSSRTEVEDEPNQPASHSKWTTALAVLGGAILLSVAAAVLVLSALSISKRRRAAATDEEAVETTEELKANDSDSPMTPVDLGFKSPLTPTPLLVGGKAR